MPSSSTAYVKSETIDTALEILTNNQEARIIAGGYSLIPQIKDGIETPEQLVDISELDELRGITYEAGELHIGALTTHDQIASSPTVREHARAIADATDSVGDYQAKHQGTIAGNLVFADPKYDAPAAFLALGGRIVARSLNDKRTIPADKWFSGPGETALGPNELVTEIVIPNVDQSGYIRTSEYSGYAIIGASVALETENNVVKTARVAVNGAKAYPIRLSSVEDALISEPITAELGKQAAESTLDHVGPETLSEGESTDSDHRQRLTQTYCQRAINRAVRGD